MPKYGVWARRSGYSVAGAAEAWLKSDGNPVVFDTKEEAAEYARKTNEGTRSPHVSYSPKEIDFEIKEPQQETGDTNTMSMGM